MKKRRKLTPLNLNKINVVKLSNEQFTKIFGGTQGHDGCDKTQLGDPNCPDEDEFTVSCP
ncbi:class I lanthipeptide [Aquimarina spongiae]|uniref:Uncharacterized protein n=1 Tax=Aquimarina spongiae TaxID=570521 RepID=A0A1M6JLN7_9FLAO|nr:class I lanthipeptide [Aquimarina spongiae]SHJ47613.1 hypothetical protein SAMN04488508_109134 [Aquimarina spongiae]